MPRRYVATYVYTEWVHGADREFVHETVVEASSEDAAFARAVRHFDEMARQSSVGWRRVLKSCEVAPAPSGAVPSGGRRVYRDPETET